MTTLVRLAERDGLVTRRQDAVDGRATRVWLSPTAVDLAPVAGRVVDGLHRRVRARLGRPQPDAPPISGHDAIRAALTEFAALRSTMTADVRKVVTAGKIATVLNTWQLCGTTPAGDPVAFSGTSADVIRCRADGTWGILIDDPWGAPPGSKRAA